MYDVYARIKKRLQGERYGVYNLSKPIAAIMANILYDQRPNRKKLKRARKMLLSTPKYSMAPELVGNVCSWSVERDDHRRSAEDIQQISEYQGQGFRFVRICDLSQDSAKKLDVPALWSAARIAWRSRETLINRAFIFCAATYAIKHFKVIDEKGLTQKITRLVAYNSSNIPECFLTTACRAHGIATFSLQHGFYYDHGQKPPLAVINYENVTAQYLLVWSEFCREQISAFHNRQGIEIDFEMLTAGYLKYGTARPAPAVATEASARQHILCLLPGPKDEQGCVELLELLSKLPEDYRITVRMHPFMRKSRRLLDVLPHQASLDEGHYLADTLGAQRFTAAVGFNTTSLFETLIVQVPCAIFLASTNSFRTPEIPEFQTVEELIDLLNNPTSPAELGDYLLGSETFRYPELIGSPLPATPQQNKGKPFTDRGWKCIP